VETTLVWIVAGGLALALLGGVAAGAAVVRIPPDYFSRDEAPRGGAAGPGRRIARIAKNVAGAVLILGGLVLMLPGVPGPGIVVLLLGLALTDLPGKRRLIRRIVRKPAVLKSMNRVRRRFGRTDLVRP